MIVNGLVGLGMLTTTLLLSRVVITGALEHAVTVTVKL